MGIKGVEKGSVGGTLHRVKLGSARWSNCHWEVFKLWIRGRLKRVEFEKRKSFFEVPHAIGFTRRGHMVHFKRVAGRPKRVSFILKGRIEVVSRKMWRRHEGV